MMMIKPMSSKSIKAARLMPAATVDKPTAWFRDRGIEFLRGQDDLDAYEFAALDLNGLPVGLLHYKNSPLDEITLLFPDGEVLRSRILEVAREFDLSSEHFHWKHSEEMGEPA